MDKLKEHMLETFHNAQHAARSDSAVEEILHRLKKLYKKPQFENYIENLFHLTISILGSPENSQYTKRLLDFLSTIIQKFSQQEQSYRENQNAPICTQGPHNEDDLVVPEDDIFESDKFILKISELTRDSSINVRVNTCRLLRNIFEGFDQIDATIYSQIQENIGYTSTDKEAKVRANGLLALAAVSTSENEVIKKKKRFIAKYDPEVTVRVCAFRTLTASKENVAIFLFGINDSSVAVQKLCFMRIFREFEFGWFSEEQICTIFRQALYSNISKELLSNYIPKLISNQENGLVLLVSHFNLRNDSEFVCELLKELYKYLYKKRLLVRLVKEFQDMYFDENGMPKTPNLARHVILVWYSMVDICKEYQIVITDQNDHDNGDSDDEEPVALDLCDSIMPDLDMFCQFIENFINYHLEQSSNKKLTRSEIEELTGSLKTLIQISDFYNISDHNRSMFTDFFKTIILRKKVFLFFKKYLVFFIPRMFRNWSATDAEHAFTIIKDIIGELQKRYENSGEKCEEYKLDKRTLAQWVSSIFAGFTKSEFLLDLEASGSVLTQIFEYGVHNVIDLAVNDFSHVSIREALEIVIGLVFLNSKIWSEFAEFVYHFLPEESNVNELNTEAVRIIMDVTCLLDPEELELKHAYGDIEALDETKPFQSDRQKAQYLLENFFLNYLKYEPKKGEKQPSAVRHMTFDYRVYRLTVIGVCRYIIVKMHSCVEWYSSLLLTYLTNPLIDDVLYGTISSFVESMVHLLKEKSLNPEHFIEAFPIVVKNAIFEQDATTETLESIQIFFLNVCAQADILNALASETTKMLESSDPGSRIARICSSMMAAEPLKNQCRRESEQFENTKKINN